MAEIEPRKPAQRTPPRRRPAGPARLDQAFAQEALALAEQSAGVGVWSIDLVTGLARGTAQFFRIMGLEPSTGPVPMDAIRALRHPEDRERVLAGFRKALEDGTDAYEIEYRIIRPDGSVRWIFGRGRVVRNGAGRPVRYSGVDLDITDRKHAEAALAAAKAELERMNQVLEQRVRERTAELEAEARRRLEAEAKLAQAQKMEAVGQLTGGVAHDFNNLLQVILGNLQIVALVLQKNAAGSDDMLHAAIERAQRASRSAAQLVERLLAFSRRQRLEPVKLDLNALISDMADMIARTLGETIRVRTRLAPDLAPAFADRGQLEAALLNLVVNARDAMQDGGELTIATTNLDTRTHPADAVEAGMYVVLAVEDTGCGIPPEVLPRVFEPFFTTKDTGKGSGLGLSMVYGFAEQSGGHVRIESKVGAGTAVRLYLPRSQDSARAPSTGAAAPIAGRARPLATARPGETILLVEDNEEVRRFGISALEGLGYRVLPAADGHAALRLLETLSTADVQLLFTDIVLPGGMSGRALAEAVAERMPALPVLYTTGYVRPAQADPATLAGGAAILGKPYSLDKLATTVRHAIDGGAAELSSGRPN